MPALDTLDEHSDYSGFLSPKVSEGLRKAALRKLFHLPQFNVHDGLDDCCEDLTGFTPLGDIVTADMRYRLELEKERAREQLKALAESGQQADKGDAVPAVSAAEDADRPEPPPVAAAPKREAHDEEGPESGKADQEDKPSAG